MPIIRVAWIIVKISDYGMEVIAVGNKTQPLS